MKMQGLEQRLVQTLAFFLPLSALIYALNIPIYLNFIFYREQFLIAFASLLPMMFVMVYGMVVT